eukprot:s2776_g6.t1
MGRRTLKWVGKKVGTRWEEEPRTDRGGEAGRVRSYAASSSPNPEVQVRVNLREKVAVLLKEAFAWYPRFMLQKRVREAWEKGVETKIVVMDGNLKLAGRTGARPHAEVEHSPELNMSHLCTRSADAHTHLESQPPADPFPRQAEVIAAHRRSPRVKERHTRWKSRAAVRRPKAWCFDVQDAQGVGTLAEEAYPRWPGQWVALCCHSSRVCVARKALLWVGVVERYFFLAELVAACGDVDVVVHDDACHVRKYCSKHQARSELAARLVYPRVKYILDRWHQRGHVDEWCREHCAADTEENQAILAGVNTSRAESWNSLMSRHKWVVRQMSHLTRSFFIHEIVDIRNAAMLQAAK